jgi:flagellar hook-associated protein 2
MVSPLANKPNIPTSGTNTGVVPPDVLARVTQTLQSKNTLAPQINAALATDRTKLSGLGQLQSALNSFQTVAQSISGEGLQIGASSSAGNVLKVIGSKSAQAGSFNVVVNQLAQGQVLQTRAVASSTAAIGAGTPTSIKIDFGSTSNGAFVPGGTPKSVTINSGNNSLQGIASAINEGNFGVEAKVVKSGNQAALQLTAPTGSNQTLRISVNGDAALKNLLSNEAPNQQNLGQVRAGTNAEFTVNGVAGTSQTNVTTTAIAGTRLELNAKGSSQVVVTQDSSQVVKNVDNLVSAFNTLNGKLRSLAQNELKNDGTAKETQERLQRTLRNSSVTGTDGNTFNLASVGINIATNGDLTLDRNKLQAAIVTDPGAVSRLFAQSGTGVADGLSNQVKSLTGANGSVTRETAAVNKDISALNTKKTNLARALTLQANALVKQYSQQQSNALPGLPNGTSSGNLFDILG